MITVPDRHRQTDGRTDGRFTVASPRSALATRGKYGPSDCTVLYRQQTDRQTHCTVYTCTLTHRGTMIDKSGR